MRRHRYPLASMLALTLALGAPAHAQKSGGMHVNVSVPDSVAHIVDRADPARGRYAIVRRDGTGELVLMDKTIVAQVTGRGLARMKSRGDPRSTRGTGEAHP